MDGEYANLPTSPAIDNLVFLLAAGPHQGVLSDIHRVSAGRHVEIIDGSEPESARMIEFHSGDSVFKVLIPDTRILVRGTVPARNVFLLLLIMMAQQCLHKGTLTCTVIEFKLQDLVDCGLYASVHAARVGFVSAMTILQSIQVSWQTRRKRQIHGRVLFTGYDVVNGACSVTVNDAVDWSYIVQYYTLLPTCYASLPQKAADLLYYIMYLLRQNVKHILESDTFSIKLRTLQIRLVLPSEKDTKNPLRDILQAIRSAVDQINAAVDPADLHLEIDAPPGGTTEAIQHGRLVIHVGGNLFRQCQLLSDKRAKRLSMIEKRS